MPNLFIVATPIGNLEDLSDRAKRALGESDLILAEDTRRTKILLTRFGIERRVESAHQHTNPERLQAIFDRIHGVDVVYVTDAGTPNVEDPGFRLVEAARMVGYRIVPIPGPSAVTAIISVANFPVERPLILGFLPKKKGRHTLFQKIAELRAQKLVDGLVICESPYRIIKTLEECREALGDCSAVLGRELTKEFEELRYGRLSEVSSNLRAQGEFTLLISLR